MEKKADDERAAYPETDLIDVWLIVRHYRWYFAIVFAIVAALGITFAYLSAPRYTTSTVVQTGELPHAWGGLMQPMMARGSVKAILMNSIIPSLGQQYAKHNLGILANTRVITAGGLVVIKTDSSKAQAPLADRWLTAVGNRLVTSENVVIQAYLSRNKGLLNTQITRLRTKMNKLQKTIHQPHQRFRQSNRLSATLPASFEQEFFRLERMSNMYTLLASFEQELFHLKRMRNIRLYDDVRFARVISKPHSSLSHSGMSRSLKVLLSLLLGILAGLFAVLLAHLRHVAKSRSASSVGS